MTYIKRVVMTGFKSFGNRTVSVNLAKGFTCIVGPNGNGKSNVIDGLCFALGRLAKSTMRATKLTDLIFAGSKKVKPATRAEVEIVFDNKDRVFPSDSDEFKVSRWIKRSGTSGYRIQGKASTRTAILNALAQANIDPDGSNQFVLQGKIVELTHMSSNARREFIEMLIGLSKYDEMKDKTLKELEKADKDLGQFEAIFKEVSTQLKKVEKEKNDALRWKELDNKVNLFNAQLIALKIHKMRLEEDDINAEIESTQLVIEDLKNRIQRQKDKIEAEALFLKGLEEDIEVQETEKTKLDEEITAQKAELSAKEATLKATEENLKRLQQNIIKLEELQEKLEEGQTFDDLIARTKTEIDGVQQALDENAGLIEENKVKQKEEEQIITDINAEKAQINKEISKIKQDSKALTTEIKLLEKSIKKNEKRKSQLDKDLQKLQKDAESIEQAMEQANTEAKAIQDQITKLKQSIIEQKNLQKQLDEEILKLEKQRDTVAKSQSDIQAAVSSTGAEINLIKKRIEDLESKKNTLQKEYEKLTKGQAVEDQIKILRSKEKKIGDQVKDLKSQLNSANEEQKRSQTKQESFELKRRALEGELGDLEKKLTGIGVELKTAETDLHSSQRQQQHIQIIHDNLQKEIAALSAEQTKLQAQLDNFSEKIEHMKEEREKLQETIDKKEAEHNETQVELNSVLDNLTNLILNIDRSAGDIKSDIQNVSQVAIDESSKVFKAFVLDVTDMLRSIEEISEMTPDQPQEIQEQLSFAVNTLKLLIENAEQPLIQLNEMVQEASDEALNESTANFDGFIQDFTDKFDSIRVALQAVAVADTSEHYRALEDLNTAISAQADGYSKASIQFTKITAQLEQKQQELNQVNSQMSALTKKINDLESKISTNRKEFEEKSTKASQIKEEIESISKKLTELKQSSENFWKDSKDLQSLIDEKSEELAQIVDDLNSLSNVKRLLDDIDNATEEQQKLQVEIETKNQNIQDLSTQSEKVQKEIDEILAKISEVKEKRAKADDVRTDLQAQIDLESDKLGEVNGRIKDLQNVQKIISDIEALEIEITESTEKIAENTKSNEELENQIHELESQIEEKNKLIAEHQTARQSLESKEKELRAQSKEISNQIKALEKKLDKQVQMKAREGEIEQLKDEEGELGDKIADFQELIKSITDKITKLEESRLKQIEILTDLQGQKNASWEKQKSLRDELGELNADLSRNNAKFNGLETRKIVVEEKIDELFEKSKDYGTLPPVTDDLNEETLNQKIGTANTEKKALEPVNLKSIEEYDEVKERWDEIDMRRQTLQRERKAILDSIDRIELEKTRNFMKAYHEINRVFSSVFQKLSPGGSAKMILENPAHPFEGGITIEARPRGKKISSLDILSGGEKTLVALSFIFAIQNFYPAPFYIMDEIDAALDGPNVYRTSMVIKEYARQSQFLVISHREENITNADRIYGVAMNDGITDIFTVNLEEEKEREDFDTNVELVKDTPDQN
ncbi:MAG: AAA family ATPase [Promethearchaeota archaeon]